jgi:pimeloyl-ACP methyl ester carboxylesterase
MSEAAVDAVPGLERLWIAQSESTSSDRTEAWLLRAGDPNGSSEPRTLVCFTHGNAELIDQCLAEARAWRDRGFHVLLPEYRGYGRSAGSPSQDDIVRDVDRAVEIALERTGARSLIFHGRSLGTGIAVQVASRHRDRTRALVLESPFRSVASFAWRYGVPEFIVRDPYRTDELLPSFRCPTLILHAPLDEVVPFAHGEALASLQPLAMLVPLEGSHNSGLSSTSAYWRAIDDLLQQAGGRAH